MTTVGGEDGGDGFITGFSVCISVLLLARSPRASPAPIKIERAKIPRPRARFLQFLAPVRIGLVLAAANGTFWVAIFTVSGTGPEPSFISAVSASTLLGCAAP